MADDTLDTTRDERMTRLDRYQPAEPMAEHKDWPESQRATDGEENNAKPANGLSIESPEIRSVCVGWQVGGQQPDQREDDNDPAVCSILAFARAHVTATEDRYARDHEGRDREGGQGRLGKKGSEPAKAEDGESEIGKGPHQGDER